MTASTLTYLTTGQARSLLSSSLLCIHEQTIIEWFISEDCMRFFRALCATLGAFAHHCRRSYLGAHAADALTSSEAYVLTPRRPACRHLDHRRSSRTMSESTCTPYARVVHGPARRVRDATITISPYAADARAPRMNPSSPSRTRDVRAPPAPTRPAAYRKTFGASLLASVQRRRRRSATSGAATFCNDLRGTSTLQPTWTAPSRRSSR